MLSRLHYRILFFLALLVCSIAFLKDVSGVPSHWMPNDKVMHAIVFAVLALLWQFSFKTVWWLGLLLLAGYGGAVELAQHYFTNRFGDWWDWLADLLGIALGILIWHALFKPRLTFWLRTSH